MNVDPLRKQQTLSMKMQTVMGMEEIKMQVIKACLMMMPRCPFLILRAKVLLGSNAGVWTCVAQAVLGEHMARWGAQQGMVSLPL